MKKMLVAFCLVLSLVFMVAVCASAAPNEIRLTMVTGGQANPWSFGGAVMADSWNKNIPGLYVTSTNGGAESNVRDVADGTDAQLGITWAPFYYNALRTEGMFADMTEAPKIKAIMNFIQVNGPIFVASKASGITKFEDITGKRFLAGYTGSGVEYTSRLLLDAYGTSYEKLQDAGTDVVFADFGEAPALMNDGHIDVFSIVGNMSHPTVKSIEAEQDITILQFEQSVMDKIIADYPGFMTVTMPANTYKGQDKDLTILAYNTLIIGSESIPDDVVYNMVKDVYERNQEGLHALAPEFSTIVLDNAWAGIGWDDLHPGAQKYYLEKGIGPKN